jgi:hypothetical protein
MNYMLFNFIHDRKIHIWELNCHNAQVQQTYVLAGNNSTVTAIDFDNEGVRN